MTPSTNPKPSIVNTAADINIRTQHEGANRLVINHPWTRVYETITRYIYSDCSKPLLDAICGPWCVGMREDKRGLGMGCV